jgi:hypothetical protein
MGVAFHNRETTLAAQTEVTAWAGAWLPATLHGMEHKQAPEIILLPDTCDSCVWIMLRTVNHSAFVSTIPILHSGIFKMHTGHGALPRPSQKSLGLKYPPKGAFRQSARQSFCDKVD